MSNIVGVKASMADLKLVVLVASVREAESNCLVFCSYAVGGVYGGMSCGLSSLYGVIITNV